MDTSLLFSISLMVLYFALLLDFITTFIGVSKGLGEGNPIMRPIINWYGKNTFRWFLGGSVGLGAVIFLLGETVGRIPRPYDAIIFYVAAAFEFYTAFRNYRLGRGLKVLGIK